MAFVAVANYTQPNFEMGYALKFMRLMLLVLTAVLDWIGFLLGCLFILCLNSEQTTAVAIATFNDSEVSRS